MIQEKDFNSFLKYIEGLELLPSGVIEDIKPRDDSFTVIGRNKKGTRIVSYSLPVEKNENLKVYQSKGYTISLLTIGEIPHKKLSKVDTAKLEQLMQKVDWLTVMPVDIRHDSRIAECIVQLGEISNRDNEEGRKIAELLTLKYMAGTPLELLFEFSDLRNQYEKTLFVELNGNEQDIGLSDSFNIICDRGVAKPLDPADDDSKICWLVMRDSEIIKVPDFNIYGHLLELPFAEKRSVVQIAQDLTELCNGEQLEGRFKIGGQVFSAFYEADPINRGLAFRDLRQNRFDLKTLKESPERLGELVQQSKKPRKGLGL